MSKNPNTQKIKSYLRENHLNTILSSDISNVSNLKKNLKNYAIEHLNITEDIWKSNSEHISSYIKALLTIDYLKVNKQDIYNNLFNCKNKDEVITLISGNIPEGFSNGKGICKHIISEIKYLKKISDSSYQLTINYDAVDDNTSEVNVVIENNQTSEQVLENTKPSPNSNNSSIEDTPKEKISITIKDLNKLIKDDKEFYDTLLNISDEKIVKIILDRFKDTYNISSELIEEWINTYKKELPIILEESKSINELVILKESAAEEIKNLHTKIDELNSESSNLKDENDTLKLQLEDVNKQLENYRYKTPNLSSQHVFSVELKELNSMLNSNSSESEITVKDEILNRISEYIDKYSLLKASDIIQKNRDIKSEIVQIILLAFLHEKSLLLCYIKS